jgi:hypothetical protein
VVKREQLDAGHQKLKPLWKQRAIAEEAHTNCLVGEGLPRGMEQQPWKKENKSKNRKERTKSFCSLCKLNQPFGEQSLELLFCHLKMGWVF